MLICTRCKTEKPKDLIHFPPHNKTSTGLDSWCRSCRSIYRKNICRGIYRNIISDDDLIKIKNTTKECVICGTETKLVVDHDHKTEKFRGLICSNCNLGLGKFKDDPELLEFARMYLLAANDDEEWKEYCQNYQ